MTAELTPLDRWVRALLARPAFRAAVVHALSDEAIERGHWPLQATPPPLDADTLGRLFPHAPRENLAAAAEQLGGETQGQGRTM